LRCQQHFADDEHEQGIERIDWIIGSDEQNLQSLKLDESLLLPLDSLQLFQHAGLSSKHISDLNFVAQI